MRDAQFHPIDDYLSENWLDEWTKGVIGEIELYLATYPAQTDAAQPPPE